MLEGKNVNLRLEEKEDVPLIAKWLNSSEYTGRFNPLAQFTREDLEKQIASFSSEMKYFIIEKKNETGIGHIGYYTVSRQCEIGFAILPSERGKGYSTEAVEILVDYLFLSKGIVRVQAHTEVRNVASQKVLERVGFEKEGVVRKSLFIGGEWRDTLLFSNLREEWKEPRILTETSVKKQ